MNGSRRLGPRLRCCGVVAALAWTGLLVLLRVWSAEDLRAWQLFAEARFVGLSAGLLMSASGLAGAYLLLYAPLGVFCAMGFRRVAGLLDELRAAFQALLLAVTCVLFVVGFDPGGSWRLPGVVELLLPVAGCAIGVTLAGAFVGAGGPVLRRLLTRVALLGMAAVAALAAVLAAALVASPPSLPPTTVTSDERRAVVAELRRHNPLRLREGDLGELALAPEQLGTLLAWSLQLLDPEARAGVDRLTDGQRILASIRLPAMPARYRYLTLSGDLAFNVQRGRLRTDRCDLAVGDARLPAWLCRSLLRSVHRTAFGAGARGAIAPAIELLRLDGQGLTVRYTRPELDERFRERLQQLLGPGSQIEAAAHAQFELLRATGELPAGADARLGALLAATFRLARERSVAGNPVAGNPVAENQGAILALATVLGHQEVATLAGIDRPPDWPALRRALQPVGLHGRNDWVRHFLVSAAITQFSAAAVSDAAGLLKEELDMERRSGFSFGDLLADRAGTRFGELAARGDLGARALQEALAGGVPVGYLMPAGADLPEGLDDAALNAQYGGVGGPGYQALTAEIEARLAALPVF